MDTVTFFQIITRTINNYNCFVFGFVMFVCFAIPSTIFMAVSYSRNEEIIYVSVKIGLILSIIALSGMLTSFFVWYLSFPIYIIAIYFIYKADKRSYQNLLLKKQIDIKYYTSRKSFISAKCYILFSFVMYVLFIIFSYVFEKFDLGWQV